MISTVAVTGANGYIGSHIVNELLGNGYSVFALIRDIDHTGKFSHISNLKNAKSDLVLKEIDLMSQGSIMNAIQGSDYIIHCASPAFPYSRDPWNDIYYPTVDGCKNILTAASQVNTIKRAILTSSAATITNRGQIDKVFNEDDWNTKSDINTDPYFKAKTDAEKWAWKFMDESKPSFDLISINPTTPFGPSFDQQLNISPELIKDLIEGKYPVILDLVGGLVDVRDVARCHRYAIENPKASGRYICSAENWSIKDIVFYLDSKGFEEAKLPTQEIKSKIGNSIVRLLTYSIKDWRGKYLRQHVGRPARFSNNKITFGLGIRFLPVKQSIDDTIADLVKWGHIKLET